MKEETIPGAVFDCMVYLQAIVNEHGPSAAVVRAVREDRVLLFHSAEIVAELRDVLSRPILRQKFPRLTAERVEALIQLAIEKGVSIQNVPPEFVCQRDPKDEKYINLAIVAKADYIVSRDNDLLDLMDESRRDGREFRARFPMLTILDPVMFLNRIAPIAESTEAQQADKTEPE